MRRINNIKRKKISIEIRKRLRSKMRRRKKMMVKR